MKKAREKNDVFQSLTLSIAENYRTEDPQSHIKYFSAETKEKKPYKVRLDVNKNQLYRRVDRKTKSDGTIPNGIYLYVVSTNGGLYLLNDAYKIRHSTIRNGRDVLCAGHMTVRNGNITRMDNNSGHYKPGQKNLHIAAMHLYHQGLLSSDCMVSDKRDQLSMFSQSTTSETKIESLLDDSPYRQDYQNIIDDSSKYQKFRSAFRGRNSLITEGMVDDYFSCMGSRPELSRQPELNSRSGFDDAHMRILNLINDLGEKQLITSTEKDALIEATNKLVKSPETYVNFLELAKNHEAVAGGKLTAYMMLLGGWAAKISTAGSRGDMWIQKANEKIKQIASIEEFAETSRRRLGL